METQSDAAADLPERVARWIAGGESYEVEFKGEHRERLNDRDLVEEVVCLANGTGGLKGKSARHVSGGSTAARRRCMPEAGLSCGKTVPSRRWRLSSPAARRVASAVKGIYFAASSPLSPEPSS